MNIFSTDFKLGILGGGQLGKMLLYTTRKWDIHTIVLDPSSSAPSRLACNEFEQGDLLDYDTVYNFGKKVDLLTIEIENVNVDALAKLEQEGLKVYPSADTLKKIQNKADQKDFYVSEEIPTAPHKRFNSIEEVNSALGDGKISLPFVWKQARFGYDGQGVKIVKSQSDLGSLKDGECIAEELIPFKNELAVIVARNSHGEVKTFPVVEMEFHPEANQVEYVLCPARISEDVERKAREVAVKVSEAFEHVGLLAVEMFQTKSDTILVNEVAPRPHNSGHHTIESNFTSQFEQHIRAILGLPLGSTKIKIPAIMVNLVGSEGHHGAVQYSDIDEILAMEGVTPHIYGKKDTRPFRKMGHVTIVNKDLAEARKVAEVVKNTIRVESTNAN